MAKKNDMDHMRSILAHAASAKPEPLPQKGAPVKPSLLPNIIKPGTPPRKPVNF